MIPIKTLLYRILFIFIIRAEQNIRQPYKEVSNPPLNIIFQAVLILHLRVEFPRDLELSVINQNMIVKTLVVTLIGYLFDSFNHRFSDSFRLIRAGCSVNKHIILAQINFQNSKQLAEIGFSCSI